MLKIERIQRAGAQTIKLIGQLETESLPELKALIEISGAGVVLEMDEVTLVDREAVRFLVDCGARSIPLRGCAAYIREWMTQEREARK